LKIGLFRLMNEAWLAVSHIELSAFEYQNFLEKGNEISKYLKQMGCNFVIALTHMGTSAEFKLLADDNNIDLILRGYDYMCIVKRLGYKLLVKSGVTLICLPSSTFASSSQSVFIVSLLLKSGC